MAVWWSRCERVCAVPERVSPGDTDRSARGEASDARQYSPVNRHVEIVGTETLNTSVFERANAARRAGTDFPQTPSGLSSLARLWRVTKRGGVTVEKTPWWHTRGLEGWHERVDSCEGHWSESASRCDRTNWYDEVLQLVLGFKMYLDWGQTIDSTEVPWLDQEAIRKTLRYDGPIRPGDYADSAVAILTTDGVLLDCQMFFEEEPLRTLSATSIQEAAANGPTIQRCRRLVASPEENEVIWQERMAPPPTERR